ncbi:peptidase M52 [Saccharopolyspora subtropica]|uniref:Hydrogenase maturation protease n=1 Tax=Saccharopolyspora thermophila TaxID=89367 RepID=A0A917NCD2_9PSEU|nr:hydrogenase maturation protease [Saccharopolyspora subtropica]GGI86883.1 peptidase M52 [Saccharopolyspora subtropica]
MGRVLVAGVGNVFRGDDGFGVAVADRLSREPVPGGVVVADYGVRGLHLAYELLDGYDALILVDAVARGEEPGTLFVVEPDAEPGGAPPVDSHGMNPQAVLALCRSLGAEVGRVLLVGCEPADCGERMGLSGPVARSVDAAARLVQEVLRDVLCVR